MPEIEGSSPNPDTDKPIDNPTTSEIIQVGGEKVFSFNKDLRDLISSRNQFYDSHYYESSSESESESIDEEEEEEVLINPDPDIMSQLLEYFFNVRNQDESLKLNIQWLNSHVSDLHQSVRGFDDLSDAEKGKHIMEGFLFSDIKWSCGDGGGGVLPENVNTLHDVNLPGPFVLQVNKIVAVCVPPKDRDRFLDLPYGIRCLELSMTDGVQCVTGVEHRCIEDLRAVSSPAGFKVLIRNVNVRHGRLMLVPEGLTLLGGMVEDLEEMDDAPYVWRCKKKQKIACQESKKRKEVEATVSNDRPIYTDTRPRKLLTVIRRGGGPRNRTLNFTNSKK